MIPDWQGKVKGESGLALAVIMGMTILCGTIVITITSLAGLGLALAAICKTSQRQGLIGLLFNITILIIITIFWLWIKYRS